MGVETSEALSFLSLPLCGEGGAKRRVGIAHPSAQTDNLLKQPPPVSLIASRPVSHLPTLRGGGRRKSGLRRENAEVCVFLRHCEKRMRRSNPAFLSGAKMDCFAALAMTAWKSAGGGALIPPPRSVGRDKKQREFGRWAQLAGAARSRCCACVRRAV